MLAGMQRLNGARRYSRVKRAVENRKKRDREMFRFCRFSGIGCGKGCLSCGVIQKGRFCPCGEWRGDRFYHPVVSYGLIEPYISLTATNTGGFFKKRFIFRKRNLSLTKIPVKDGCIICSNSSTGIILNGSYHSQDFADGPFPSGSPSSYEPDTSCSWFQAL